MSEIVAAATDALHDLNARLVICTPDGNSSSLRDRLLPDMTDGALLITPSERSEEMIPLLESGYPFVVIEPTVSIDERIPVVAATNWAGARAATEHLIGLGHTH